MEKLLIRGKKNLIGKISISGSKNATLPILAASILSQKVELSNVPLVKDIVIKIIEILQLPKIDNKQILNAATSIKYKQINAIN